MGNKPTSSVDKQTSSVDKPISEASSRCFAQCITIAHNFVVIRYSLLEGMGAGKFVSSSTFSVRGYDWNIRIYPDGWKVTDRDDYMSAFLCFSSGTPDVKVKYTLSLLTEDGNVSHLENSTQTFERACEVRGWNKFIEKSKLQELLSHNDDCFTIRCVLTIIKEPRTEDLSTTIDPVPESNLHAHFASMLKDGEGVDVTFSVGDQLFSAHRYVLAARSTGHLWGSSSLHIHRVTDSVPGDVDVDQSAALQHLLVAADRYGLDRLKAICEGKLCKRIDVQTVATTLALAEQHQAMQLKITCLAYLSSPDVLRVVKHTDGFKHLAASCSSIMMDLFLQCRPTVTSTSSLAQTDKC